MFFVKVPLVFVKLTTSPHNLSNLRPRVHPLQVVYLETRVRRAQPVPTVETEEEVTILKELLLFAPHFLHIVDVSLVVLKAFKLFLE